MEWRLVREEAHDGATNMALDEVAARTAATEGLATARVYRWDPGALSLGYRQDPATVDWTYCERTGVDVVRRPTGGGGIYHDAVGDISYSIAAPADRFPSDLTECYRELCEPVFDAFERLGVDAHFAESAAPGAYQPACYLRERDPAHDVVVDGAKVSGNAQYRRRDAVVQHGSLTYAAVPERHRAVFADAPAAFESHATAIAAESGAAREDAVTALEAALREWADAEAGTWTESELAAADALADAKYRDPAWTRDREAPDFEVPNTSVCEWRV